MGKYGRPGCGGRHPKHCLLFTRVICSRITFAWKYHDDFSMAILANAKAGGSANCHRIVVLDQLSLCKLVYLIPG